jgi:hypothetical protein
MEILRDGVREYRRSLQIWQTPDFQALTIKFVGDDDESGALQKSRFVGNKASKESLTI